MPEVLIDHDSGRKVGRRIISREIASPDHAAVQKEDSYGGQQKKVSRGSSPIKPQFAQ
jgi:hypothetical protein